MSHLLEEQITLLKPELEKKGWHVFHNKYYIGITGYRKYKKHQKINPDFLNDSSCEFEIKNLLGDIKKNIGSIYESNSLALKKVLGTKHGTLSFDEELGKIFYIQDKNYSGEDNFYIEAIAPRETHIVSFNCFQNSSEEIVQYDDSEEAVENETTSNNLLYEVKTYWTTKRNLFKQFDQALELFLEEVQKYDPSKLKWSMLDGHHEDQKSSVSSSTIQNK